MRWLQEQRKKLILIDEGVRFHSTSHDEGYLKETIAFIKKWHPEAVTTIKLFYVNIERADPETNIVSIWKKEEGFSLWYYPTDAFD